MAKSKSIFFFCFCFFFIVICYSCVSTKTIPTLSLSEYVLDPGPDQVQKIAGIEISLKVIQLSELYDYPNFFSFDLDQFPELYKKSAILRSEYPPGPNGRSWEFPFATPDGKFQLVFCFCKIKNNTKHILRMGDARIYFVVEGIDPLPAIRSFDELLQQADYFEATENLKRSKETTLFILKKAPLPDGFFRAIILSNRRAYNLINDLKHEILPGFSYEGILAFPAMPSLSAPAKITFFDVTISTDKAGNPTEKTQFDFKLQSKFIQMYLDIKQKKWVVGNPPDIKKEDTTSTISSDSGGEIQKENPNIAGKNVPKNTDKSQKTQEESPQILIVKANTANIRQEPSLSGKILTTVRQGAQLKLIGIDGDWFEIVIEDKTELIRGYIHKSLVEIKK